MLMVWLLLLSAVITPLSLHFCYVHFYSIVSTALQNDQNRGEAEEWAGQGKLYPCVGLRCPRVLHGARGEVEFVISWDGHHGERRSASGPM